MTFLHPSGSGGKNTSIKRNVNILLTLCWGTGIFIIVENQVKGLESDEVEFLEFVSDKQSEITRAREKETETMLEEYRVKVFTLILMETTDTKNKMISRKYFACHTNFLLKIFSSNCESSCILYGKTNQTNCHLVG